ncbi:MAG: DUF86 domain-containing protein [Planctomycetes bacterium]|nr:DUF86 domain-containing protein [Planctomycetota bacterium]
MTRHDDRIRLLHMLEHAVEAVQMIREHTRADLDTDRKLNLALVRLVEIIGEAATRMSPEVRNRHPGIPWLDIIGMRNRIVHGYDQVDFDILWDVMELHLPPLITELQRILDVKNDDQKQDNPGNV